MSGRIILERFELGFLNHDSLKFQRSQEKRLPPKKSDTVGRSIRQVSVPLSERRQVSIQGIRKKMGQLFPSCPKMFTICNIQFLPIIFKNRDNWRFAHYSWLLLRRRAFPFRGRRRKISNSFRHPQPASFSDPQLFHRLELV